MGELYTAAAVTLDSRSITNPSNPVEIKENLQRTLRMIDAASKIMEPPLKLIAFQESFLQPVEFEKTKEKLMNVTIRLPGEETDKIGEMTKKYNLYFVGTSLEYEDDWPTHFFNTAFIIDPNGKLILKYRKVNTTNSGSELATSPHDILNEYENKGLQLWPVAKTEIGNLGTYIGYDRWFPETARALAMNGAEVLIGPSTWKEPYISEPPDWWMLFNKADCFFNQCYGVFPISSYTPRSDNTSMIVNYKGDITAAAGSTMESITHSTIDIEALREWRTNMWGAYLAQIRTEAYVDGYLKKYFKVNSWLKKAPETLAETWDVIAKSIETVHGVKTKRPRFYSR
jgi:predicted amidohydrolase